MLLAFALVVPPTFFTNPKVAYAATTLTDTFSTVGYTTWTAPAGIGANVSLACWGGGGAGAAATVNNGGGGDAGGGGAFASSTISVTQGDVIRLFVGAGGTTAGANGATSTASTTGAVLIVSAAPGWGGKGQTISGGLGGAVASSTGTVRFAGGKGGVGVDGGSNKDYSGGGGGAGGPDGEGGLGDPGTSLGSLGGNGDANQGGAAGFNSSDGGSSVLGGGGGGGAVDNAVGGNGGTYGGGGGGSGVGGTSTGFGTGASGACTVTYSVTKPTVTTSAATSITATSSVLNGNITANSATSRGFASSTSSTLTTGVSTTTTSGTFGISAFTGSMGGLNPNTTYYFRAFATNADGTSFGSIQSFTTSLGTTTLADSTDPSNSTIAPGEPSVAAGKFTFTTNSGSDSVTAVVVGLGSGAAAGISRIDITDNAASTTFGSISDPNTDTPTITLAKAITATTSATIYQIRITPKSHSNMPSVPGSSYSVQAKINSFTSTNSQAGSDTAGTTITIDNTSPNDATSATASAGSGQVDLAWTNSNSSDFAETVILRSTSPISTSTFEGTRYSTSGSFSDLAISSVGAPALARLSSTTVAFIDLTNHQLREYSFDGTTWSLVGSGKTLPVIGNPALTALNSTDVAFIDSTVDKLAVYRFNGSTWTEVGASTTISIVGAPALTTLNATDVAFADETNDSLRVYRFNGSSWSQVGNSFNLTGALISNVSRPAMAAISSSTIVYIDGGDSGLHIFSFDGTNWTQLDGFNSYPPYSENHAIVAFSSTTIAVAEDNVGKIFYYRLNGFEWEQMGSVQSTDTTTGGRALAALNATDVAFIDPVDHSLRTYRFDLQNWSQTKNTIGSSTVVYAGTGTSFSDTSVANGTPYYYKIFSRDNSGNYSSGTTPTGSPATPNATAPSINTISASNIVATSSTLNADITSTGGATVTARGFATSTDASLSSSVATTTESGSFSTGTFSTTSSNLTGNTIYFFRAFATNSSGTSYGAITPFGTPPGVIAAPSISNVAATSTTVTWSAPTGGVDSYKLFYCSTTSCTLSTGLSVTSTSTNPSLVGNTTYTFAVRGTNSQADGLLSASTTQLTVPNVPGTPTFTNTSFTTLTVNWVGSVGSSSSYKVERCTGSSCSDFVEIASGIGTTTYNDSGLSQNTTYNYRVRGTNATGNGLYSAAAPVTTVASPTITLTGTLYAGEGVGPITSGKTIKASVNGGTPAQATSDGSGNFAITIDIPGINQPVAVWVDGDSSTRAFTFTKATSTTALGGIPLYQNRVTIFNQGTTTVTNAELGTYDSSDDADIQFLVSGTSLTTNAGQKLYIAPRTTFVPGGAVTTHGNAGATPDGDLGLGHLATFIAGGDVTIAGSLLASTSANFLIGGAGIYFTASTTGKIISGPFSDYRGLGSTTFSGSGTWTFASNASTTNNISVSGAGTVVAPSDLWIAGGITNTGTFTAGSGTTTFTTLQAAAGIDASGGMLAQIGSSAFSAVFATGTYLYVVKAADSTDCAAPNKIGCELQIFNISSSTSPVFVGGADASGNANSGIQSSALNSIYVQGNYAYVAKANSPTDCATVGNKIGCELQVYDISNPSTPTFVGGADARGTTNSGTGSVNFSSVFVSGNYAYITTGSSSGDCSTSGDRRGCELKVFDISTPSAPTFVGGADASGSTNSGTTAVGMNSVYVSGIYAYIAKSTSSTDCSGSNKSGCEFQIYNISDPANPTFAGGADADGTQNGGTSSGQVFSSVFVSGNYAYIAAAASSTACTASAGAGNGCELKVFDIGSVPGTPTYVGGADATGNTNLGTGLNSFTVVYVSGNYAYLAAAGSTSTCSDAASSALGCELKVFDVGVTGSPSAPKYVGGADASGNTNSSGASTVARSFNSVYVLGSSLFIVKAGDSTDCIHTSLSSAYKLGCELQTYDISSSTNPVIATGIDATVNGGAIGSSAFNSTFVSGKYLYVAKAADSTDCGDPTNHLGCEFQIYDVSASSSPVYIGGADNGGEANAGAGLVAANSVFVSGNYAYVGYAGSSLACSSTASANNGCELKIFDISNPASPLYVAGADASGSINSGNGSQGNFLSVYVSGNYAYIAKGVDSSDCSTATKTGCEFQIYNVTNPLVPTYQGGADADGTTNGGTSSSQAFNSVFVSGNYAYVAAAASTTACSIAAGSGNGCEFKVFDVTNKTTPTYIGGADAGGLTNSGTASTAFNSVFVSGNYAYITTGVNSGLDCSVTANTTNGCELKIFDISIPSTPMYMGGADSSGAINSGTTAQSVISVFATGSYLYVGKAGDSTSCSDSNKVGCELQVYDISSSTLPVFVGSADSTGSINSGVSAASFNSVFVTANTVYVGKGASATDCAFTPDNRVGCELLAYKVSDLTTGSSTLSGNFTGTSALKNVIINSSAKVQAPTLLEITGNYSNSGTFGAGSGTTTFSGSSLQTISGAATGTSAFNNLAFSGAGNKFFSAGASSTNVTITSGTVSTPLSLSITGNYANNGGTHKGYLLFNGANQAISGSALQTDNVEFAGSGTKTFTANASTTGFLVDAGTTVVAPSLLSISGNYSNLGTFTAGSGTVFLNESSSLVFNFVGGADADGTANNGISSQGFNDVFISGNYAYVAAVASSSPCSATAGAGNGCELKVFDISNPAVPVYVGGADSTGQTNIGFGATSFYSLFVSGSYAYIAQAASSTLCSAVASDAGNGCELKVFNISNPSLPTYIGGADISGATNASTTGSSITEYFDSVHVSGNYVYLVTHRGNSTNCATVGNKIGCELQVYSISDPANPTFVGGADTSGVANSGTFTSDFYAAVVSGSYAYVVKTANTTDCAGLNGDMQGCELQIYNISDPANPTYVGGADVSGATNSGTTGNNAQDFTDIAISGSYAYITTAGSTVDCGTVGNKEGCELQIYDISNPAAPTFVGGADYSGATNSGTGGLNYQEYPDSIFVSGNYAYLGGSNNNGNCATSKITCELQVYDVSVPSTPLFIVGVDDSGGINSGTGGGAVYPFVSGNYVYLAHGSGSTDCSTASNKEGCELQVYSLKANSVSGAATGTSAFNNLTVTNTSGAGDNKVSVYFQGAASTTGTFTMLASTSAQFLANATSSFQNISWVGTSISPITLRSSTPSVPWYVKVSGTQTVSYVNVSDSDACLGSTISATNSTNGGNNNCWNFNVVVISSGGGGGGSEVGGAPPEGDGDVGGGTGGGGESIGSEPGFNIPALFGAAVGWLSNWLNPGNALTQDTTYATATSFAASDFYNFGFSIPSGDAITGIAVKIVASGSTAAGTIGAEVSWNGGTATTTSATLTSVLSTGDVVYTLGGPSSLFGRSWTPTEFSNANFRVRLIANPSGGNTVKIDAIQVRVYHQSSGGGGGGGGEI